MKTVLGCEKMNNEGIEDRIELREKGAEEVVKEILPTIKSAIVTKKKAMVFMSDIADNMRGLNANC